MSDLRRYARELGPDDRLEIELPYGYGIAPQTLTWNGEVFVGPQGCEWEPDELLWKFVFAHGGEPEEVVEDQLHPWEFIFEQLLCDGHLRPRCNGVSVS